MRLVATPLAGAWVLEPDRLTDERGWFARTFDAEQMRAAGLADRVEQASIAYNAGAGTLRGMHWQAEPHGECKLVRCVAGAVYDVIVDLRPESPTQRRWFAIELSATNGRALYVPRDFAHGLQTLVDETAVFYQMDSPYMPAAARGLRWDDPTLAIDWPEPPARGRIISERDRTWPPLDP